jgi:uncharacterized membrane protein SpoIIM required for sporulation
VTNLDEFVRERGPSWGELDQLVDTARNAPARLGPVGVRRLGTTYRAVAADLAQARRRFPGDPVVLRLEQLAQRGRHAVYNTAPRRGTLREFAFHGYWRRIAERPVLLLIAAACLLVPTGLGGYWAWRDPGPASGLVGEQYQSVTQPREAGQDLGHSVDEQSALASEIFTNNIRVTFLAFAGGILFGLGTVYVLIFNGILLGVVAGLAVGSGNGLPFFELVIAHGVLELSCIIVSGAAGLRMASALIDPGTRTRGAAFRTEARAGVEMVLGTMFWLVVAGLIEGFVTPAGLGIELVCVIGFGVGALYWVLVLVLGRERGGSNNAISAASGS